MSKQSKLNLISFAGLVVMTVLALGSSNTNSDIPKNNNLNVPSTANNSEVSQPKNSPSPILTQTPIGKDSSDYKAGYSKGFREGRSWAKEVVGSTGMPQPVAIRAMAKYQAEEAKAKDAVAWQSGWEDGFVDGYRNIKPSKIKEADYEPLAWRNAKPNVKLYDKEGNYQVTIIAVNQADGKITVKYPKERGGVVEDKLLDSLSSFWFVRKSDSR